MTTLERFRRMVCRLTNRGGKDTQALLIERLRQLHSHYKEMTPTGIISELKLIHQEGGVAQWAGKGSGFGWSYEIIYNTVRRELSDGDIREFANMLQWREIRAFPDVSSRFEILRAIEKFASFDFLPLLEEHRVWVDMRRREEIQGTHFYADLHSEILILDRLLVGCRE